MAIILPSIPTFPLQVYPRDSRCLQELQLGALHRILMAAIPLTSRYGTAARQLIRWDGFPIKKNYNFGKIFKMNTLVILALSWQHILIVAIIVLLLFGGKKIPELMRGLGSGIKEFKDAVKEDDAPKGPRKDTTDNL